MAEKQIRVSGAWIGRRVEVEFVEYAHPGSTVYVSLPGRLLNVQDEGIVFAKELDSGSTGERMAPQVLSVEFHVWCTPCRGIGDPRFRRKL